MTKIKKQKSHNKPGRPRIHGSPQISKIEVPKEILNDFQSNLEIRLAEILATHPAPKLKFPSDESKQLWIDHVEALEKHQSKK